MHVRAISISDRKGIRKNNVDTCELREEFGLAGDAHGGAWHRQVSLLAQESIDTMRAKGLDVVAGNFAENITTEGIDLSSLKVGDHLAVGMTELVISQLGKICHHRCAIYHQAGDCVMPREGIFAVVHRGGTVRVGDAVRPTGRRSSTVAVICTMTAEKASGREIRKAVTERWSPAFVRIDHLNDSEENLAALLDELASRQRVDRIVVFDPEGRHALAVAGYPGRTGPAGEPASAIISHCRTADGIAGV
ncbi:MAG: MOSC domain-containing protein [Desulfobulbaceae bacterium]|nr:MAG: MOSC domain-containing protein [Desulfobulbaceae bacterium]